MTKKTPLKNYVVLTIVVILTIMCTFYMRNWYIAVRDYNSANSPILSVINEINVNEISNYVYENPKFVLYTSSGTNASTKYFEKKFKNYIKDNNLEQNMIYINVDKSGKETVKDELKKYADGVVLDRIDVNDNVSMFIFENSKIVRVINNVNTMKNDQIDLIFKKYKVLD